MNVFPPGVAGRSLRGASRRGAFCRTVPAAVCLTVLALAAGMTAGCANARQDTTDYAEARRELVRSLEDPGTGYPAVRDTRVLEAMGRVPRHRFVPDRLRDLAYADRPLPIGQGQTISQPYIVARMTELLEVEPGERVLEVGTGSGYQAAILAEITDSVYTVEIRPELARTARARLHELGYSTVQVRIGNGFHGWEAHAPYDAIVVTAAPEEVPEPLVRQLAPGGRMVIPVGPTGGLQRLLLLEKDGEGEVTRRALDPVRFVPLVGQERPARDTVSGPTPRSGLPATDRRRSRSAFADLRDEGRQAGRGVSPSDAPGP